MGNKSKFKKAWNFEEVKNGVAEITIYGNISDTVDWESGDINPEFFSSDLKWLQENNQINELVVRINSSGGDVFAATAIYSRLKEFPAKKTVKIDGWAASAATIIAMAGDTVQIAPNGSLMIHDPLFGLEGYFNADDLTKYIDQLNIIKKSIINAYKAKTGKTEEELSELMKAETWYTGQEAVDAGFCDSLMFEIAAVAATATGEIKVNGVTMLNKFRNLPTTVLNHCQNHADKDFNINNNNIKNKGKGAIKMETEENKTTEEVKEIKTVEELKEAYPDLVKQIEEEATQKELDRLKEIEAIASPGAEEIVNDAKYKSRKTAGQVAIDIINLQKTQGKNFLNAREKDVINSGMKDVNAEPAVNKTEDNEYIDAIDKVLPKVK